MKNIPDKLFYKFVENVKRGLCDAIFHGDGVVFLILEFRFLNLSAVFNESKMQGNGGRLLGLLPQCLHCQHPDHCLKFSCLSSL